MDERGPFASMLRAFRKQAGWTQEELARAAAVRTSTVSDLESGRTVKPQAYTIEKIADALRLDGRVRREFVRAGRGHVLDPAATAGPAAATRTLPRDTLAFTGRARELGRLMESAGRAAASSGGVPIVAIGGMAGVGKTTLAVHAGHELAPAFPDGQIFLRLNGHTPGLRPTAALDALESLLRLTDVTDIPVRLDDREGEWRRHLAGKRVLLVLDDAVDSDQVRPLLPGTPGSLVLVTSRLRLRGLEDAYAIDLGGMSAGDAADLLVRLAGRPGLGPESGPVREIARLCAYLPQAMSLLASQLRHDPRLGAATLASRLAAARHRADLMRDEKQLPAVTAAFDMSYRELTEEQRRTFRLLGLHSGPDIDVRAAAALLGTDVETARRDVGALYDRYLLTQPAAGRYQFHDLIREYARALAENEPEQAQQAAITGLLDYYLKTVRDVSTRTWDEALAWLEPEAPNLHAVAAYAGTHGLHQHAIAIPAAMSGFLRGTSRYDLGIKLARIALVAAEAVNDQSAAASALTDLGRFRHVTGDNAGAARDFGRAAAIQRDTGNREGQARALIGLSAVQHSLDQREAMVRTLRVARRLFHDLGDERGEADVRYRVGVLQYEAGRYRAATATLSSALAIFRELDNLLGQADVLSYLAAIGYAVGRPLDQVVAEQSRARDIYRQLRDRHEEAGALIFLGGMQRAIGAFPAAMNSLTSALRMFEELGGLFGEASTLNEMSAAQREMGDLSGAAVSVNRSLALFVKLESRTGEAEAATNLGLLQIRSGDYPAAAATLGLALERHGELGNRFGQASVCNSLGDLALASGSGDARTHYERALEIATRISAAPEKARAMEGIGRCLLADDRPDEGLRWLRQALRTYRRIKSPRAAQVAADLRS